MALNAGFLRLMRVMRKRKVARIGFGASFFAGQNRRQERL